MGYSANAQYTGKPDISNSLQEPVEVCSEVYAVYLYYK